MRFLCDAMLGGLAKWLRAAGYDAYYASEGTDVYVGFLLVPHLPLEERLRLVVERCGLVRRESRCMACGGELDPVPREPVMGRVPPGVLRDHETFFVCQRCGRIFWHGSHWGRISARLDGVFG